MSTASGFMACILLLVSVGLYFAPDGVKDREVRSTVTDSLRPGQMAARQTAKSLREHGGLGDEVDAISVARDRSIARLE